MNETRGEVEGAYQILKDADELAEARHKLFGALYTTLKPYMKDIFRFLRYNPECPALYFHLSGKADCGKTYGLPLIKASLSEDKTYVNLKIYEDVRNEPAVAINKLEWYNPIRPIIE